MTWAALCVCVCVHDTALHCRYDMAKDNASKSEPLARALKEVEVLRAALALADKDKASLGQAKARLAAAEKQVRRRVVSGWWSLGATQGARSQERWFARPASPQWGSDDQRQCSAAATPAPATSRRVSRTRLN